jgi:hypothetical protein
MSATLHVRLDDADSHRLDGLVARANQSLRDAAIGAVADRSSVIRGLIRAEYEATDRPAIPARSDR